MKRINLNGINMETSLGEKAYFRSPDLSAISRIPHFAVPFRCRVLAPFNPANGFPLRVHKRMRQVIVCTFKCCANNYTW